jgi:hypothetical protein
MRPSLPMRAIGKPSSALAPRGAGQLLRWWLCFASWCALFATVPSAATAATVTIRPDPDDPRYDDEVYYAAGADERNRLSVHHVGDNETGESSWTFSDPGAVITPLPPCVAIDAHTVRCTSRPSDASDRFLRGARADLGDEDDESRFPSKGEALARPLHVSGGTGDDRLLDGGEDEVLRGDAGNDELHSLGAGARLVGGTGDDQLFGADSLSYLEGGPGNDRLVGGAGSETLDGGGGQDQIYGGDGWDTLSDGDRTGAAGDSAPGPDVLDGGGDIYNTISYEERRAPVSVDVSDALPDGERGEGDMVAGFVDITGGKGDDRLAGDNRANTLIGGGGSDRLIGRRGADTLIPGEGGGRMSCGVHRDRISGPSSEVLIDQDCETVIDPIGTTLAAYPRASARGVLRYRAGCPPTPDFVVDEAITRCVGTVRLHHAGREDRLLGSGTFPARRRARRMVTLDLSSLGRRLASRRQGVRATLSVDIRTNAWESTVIRWTIQLRLPRACSAGAPTIRAASGNGWTC